LAGNPGIGAVVTVAVVAVRLARSAGSWVASSAAFSDAADPENRLTCGLGRRPEEICKTPLGKSALPHTNPSFDISSHFVKIVK
jgi:hypothetical protein